MRDDLKYLLIIVFLMTLPLLGKIVWDNGYNAGKNEILEKYVVSLKNKEQK